MAWTQADLDAVEKAIANGTTEVRFNDRTVRYRSLDELSRTRTMIMKDINKSRAPRRKFPTFCKGFDCVDDD